MSPWLFNVYMEAVMKEVEKGVGRRKVRFLEGRGWKLPGLLYTDEVVLFGESEDLRAMVGRFVELCRKRGLKVNVGKSNAMVLNGEEGLECEVHVDGTRLEDVFWTNQVQMKQNVVGRWKVGGGW